MAGDWIKLETVTPDKPEVLRMADLLGIAPEHALGCLIRVWIWADQQSLDGNALTVTEASLDRIARNAGVTQAMCEVGWARKLSTGKDGQFHAYSLTNFSKHNGKTAKNRGLTAQRASRFRNAKVTPTALPREEKSYISNTITSSKNTEASARASQTHLDNSTATPKAAAHSTEKARQAIEESRQAAETRAPMPEHLRAIVKHQKPV